MEGLEDLWRDGLGILLERLGHGTDEALRRTSQYELADLEDNNIGSPAQYQKNKRTSSNPEIHVCVVICRPLQSCTVW